MKHMRLNYSTSWLRTIITFFCAAIWFLSSATAKSFERVKPDDYSSRWLVGSYEIYVEMPCRIFRSPFLPTKKCSQPYIVIKQTTIGLDTYLKTSPYLNLVAGEISIGNKRMFDANYDPLKKVPISDIVIWPEKSHELFTLLMSEPDTPLKFKTRLGQGTPINVRTVVLADFEASTSETIKAIHQQYNHQEATERRNMLLALSIIGSILAFALWLVLFLIKRGRTRLQIAKQKIEMKRVARIAEDEAIREVVRNSVQKVDESELDVLRSQIKAALDVGDTETAEILLSILKKNSK